MIHDFPKYETSLTNIPGEVGEQTNTHTYKGTCGYYNIDLTLIKLNYKYCASTWIPAWLRPWLWHSYNVGHIPGHTRGQKYSYRHPILCSYRKNHHWQFIVTVTINNSYRHPELKFKWIFWNNQGLKGSKLSLKGRTDAMCMYCVGNGCLKRRKLPLKSQNTFEAASVRHFKMRR